MHRNGVVVVIDVDDVVVGDKVLLQAGDKIPADGILISGNLHVDNSALNGEAEECKKTEAPQDFQLADYRRNFRRSAFSVPWSSGL